MAKVSHVIDISDVTTHTWRGVYAHYQLGIGIKKFITSVFCRRKYIILVVLPLKLWCEWIIAYHGKHKWDHLSMPKFIPTEMGLGEHIPQTSVWYPSPDKMYNVQSLFVYCCWCSKQIPVDLFCIMTLGITEEPFVDACPLPDFDDLTNSFVANTL